MRISIILTESNDKIVRKIHKAILEDINKAFKKAKDQILDKIRKTIVFLLKSTSTYLSLTGGTLRGDFGLPAGEAKNRVDAIINEVANSIQIQLKDFKLSGSSYKNKMYVYVIPSDFKNLLSMPEAVHQTEKGEMINWLEWLLTKGNRIIISGYRVQYGQGKGRSGKAVMVKTTKKFWRVPPQFSGTIRNNWLTRAVDDNIDKLEIAFAKIIESELAKVL